MTNLMNRLLRPKPVNSSKPVEATTFLAQTVR